MGLAELVLPMAMFLEGSSTKALDTALTKTQKAMEESLDDVSLAEIIADIKK